MRVDEKDTENLKRLPDWVKCLKCGGKPKEHDWLIDLMASGQGQSSNVLIHQSCAAGQGMIAGLNVGLNGDKT